MNGRRLHVPEGMNYEEFKAKYLTPSKSDGKINQDKSLTLAEKARLTTPKTKVNECVTFDQLKHYLASTYNLSIDSSLEALNFDSVRSAASGVESVMKEFPKALGALKGLTVESGNYVMATNYSGGIIKFNPLEFQISRNLAYGGAHEGGHILEKALIDRNGGGINDWNECTFAKAIVNEAIVNLLTDEKMTSEKILRGVSAYSLKNDSECLGEAVRDFVAKGEKSLILSKEIWRLLKRELG